MIIILTGMPASGKSFLGRHVARHLNYEFIDLDLFIENIAGKSISAIFELKGENFFRQLETLCLKKIFKSNYHNLVLSLGGGTFISDENKILCKNKGKVIWINTDISIIHHRIKSEISQRPLFQNSYSQKNLEKLFFQRKIHYEKADKNIIFNANSNLSKTIEEIIYG